MSGERLGRGKGGREVVREKEGGREGGGETEKEEGGRKKERGRERIRCV